MKEKKKIPSGYKDSALGIIPEDWKLEKIGAITKTTAGGTPLTSMSNFWGGDIKWMNSGELNLKKIFDVEGRITEEGLKNSSTKIIPKKCILIGLAGQGKTRGTVAMNMIELCTNQSVAAIFPSKYFIEDYLYYNLDFRYDELRQLSTGDGGRGGLNLALINSLKVILPSIKEQKAIVNILNTWDKSIENVSNLIAKKQQRKKWLMQQLFSEKKRLKGFEKQRWKQVKIKEVFQEIKNINDGVEGHSVMTISSRLGLISQEEKFDKIIAGDSLKKYTLLRKNDFAYNKGNSKTYQMGCVYQLEEKESALVPFVYICFSPSEKVYSQFYKYWFINHGLDRQLNGIISSGARGDGLLNVNSEDFFNLKIPYPSKEEQIAIAKILHVSNKEIDLLKQKLVQLKEQKKGLMQVLLTGKQRLKIKK